MRTAQQIEEQPEKTSGIKPKKSQHPNSRKNLIAPWTSETAPKQGGKKHDVARDISRQAFENNVEAMYEKACQQIMSGAYGFQVHAERAYGKLTEKRELSGANGAPIEFREVNDEQLKADIRELERQLGFATEVATSATISGLEAGAGATDVQAEDHELLSK